MEDSNFRQALRLASLLVKMKRLLCHVRAFEQNDEKHGRSSRDVPENKRVRSRKSKNLKTLSH